jgi:hypothetical protein
MMKKAVAVFTFSLALIVLSGIFLSTKPVTAAPVNQVPFPNQVDAVNNAANWLIANHQNSDGGYTGFSAGAGVAPSDPTGTADALLALTTTGFYPQATLDYIAANSADFDWVRPNGRRLRRQAASRPQRRRRKSA